MKLWPICRILLLLVLVACHESQPELSWNPDVEKTRIDSVMAAQEKAWNQADIEGFMKGYWNSDSLCFIGKKGLTFGWKRTLDNYKAGYPDAAAMGRLRFTNERLEILSPQDAYVIGKWELFRVADTLQGHYSLLWKKIQGNWVIVADHSS